MAFTRKSKTMVTEDKKVAKEAAPSTAPKDDVSPEGYVPSPDDVVVAGKLYRKVAKHNPETNSQYFELEEVK